MDEGRAVEPACLESGKDFDTVSCDLTDKALEYRLETKAEGWTDTWLNCWAQADGDQWHKVQLEANPELCSPGVTIVTSTVQHLRDWPR